MKSVFWIMVLLGLASTAYKPQSDKSPSQTPQPPQASRLSVPVTTGAEDHFESLAGEAGAPDSPTASPAAATEMPILVTITEPSALGYGDVVGDSLRPSAAAFNDLQLRYDALLADYQDLQRQLAELRTTVVKAPEKPVAATKPAPVTVTTYRVCGPNGCSTVSYGGPYQPSTYQRRGIFGRR